MGGRHRLEQADPWGPRRRAAQGCGYWALMVFLLVLIAGGVAFIVAVALIMAQQ